MKRFNFLLVAIALVLTITAVSCTTMAGSQDDYYNGQDARVYGNRIYVEDPYRGTIVLEKNPRTGRYYEVGAYNSYYDGYYGNRYYGSSAYGNTYYGRSPYGGRSNSGSYRNNSNSNNNNAQNNQRPKDDDRKIRDEARKKILGN